jgi:hypothetical protein
MTADTMELRWLYGLGCQAERATIIGKTITVEGDGFPVIVVLETSKTALLSCIHQ